MPTMPRRPAAMLAPMMPNDIRATTGKGVPYLSDGRPIRFIRK
jgi:hypothetical protein